MPDLGLQSFNKLYPMMIRKYQDLVVDQNASEKDKINSIIQKLNALGKLSNDVVRDWNTVYNWAMNDGLNTDVSNKLEEMRANGEISQLLQNIFDSLVGSMSNLHTNAKDLLVNAINEVDDLAKANQTAITTIQGKQTTDEANIATNTANIATNTANIATNTTNIASNTSALAQIMSQAVNVLTKGAKGDGITVDNNAIQQAIIDASTNKINAVFLPPPSTAYLIDVSSPIFVPSNMRIYGIKGQSILKVKASTIANTNNYDLNHIFVTGSTSTRTRYDYGAQGSNIHFDGLVLDGNGDNVDQTSVTLLNGANGMGIKGMYVVGLTITNCEVKNFLGTGIYTYGSSKVLIADNTVHHNGKFQYNAGNGYSRTGTGVNRNGISLAGGYSSSITSSNTNPYPYSYDYIVRNNHVHDNVDEGIMFAYQKRLLITGNMVHNNGDRGIEGDSGYTTTDNTSDVNGDVTISYNFVYDHPFHGITVSSSNNQKINISHNTIRNCAGYAIFVQQSTGAEVKVTDNIIDNTGTLAVSGDTNQYHGISIQAFEVTIQNNVMNNIGFGSTNGAVGINLPRCLNAIISGNKISNTKLQGINVYLWDQVTVGDHVRSLVIANNIVTKSNQHGIYLDGTHDASSSAYNRIRQLSVVGNSVFDYGEGSTQHSCYGIMFKRNLNVDSVVVTGNTVFEDRVTKLGANAIYFDSVTNGLIVNAVISGNEVKNGSDWTPIDGWQYISYPVMEANNYAGRRIVQGTAAPTTNSWYVGDRVINTAPTASGYLGWVCVTNGTPGTWKGYGAIQA